MADNNNNNNNQERKNQQSFTQAFKQQVMKAWQPVPTINSTIILFSILSIFFLTFGIILISYSNNVKEFTSRYDNIEECQSSMERYLQNKKDHEEINKSAPYEPQEEDYCQIQVDLDEDFEGPVFVYYELDNFYQNHRRYVKSKNVDQLQGEDVKKSSLESCDPIETNKDAGAKFSFTGVPLDPDGPAIPCGLIAASYFTDEYKLRQMEGDDDEIKISDKDIAWPSDKKHKFKNPKDAENTAWIDLDNNERFMVWMRTAALPYFRKLWGRIEDDVPKGKYIMDVLNRFEVEKFDGKKYIVISTANKFGGKNSFLAISYIVVGSICCLITLGFIAKKCMNKKHAPGQQ